MIEESALTILYEPGETLDSCGFEVIPLELNILGEGVCLRVGVADEEVGLGDIVPLARKISTKTAVAVLDGVRKNGEAVACCKGCSACCNYLIPLSVPEAFRIREELLAMNIDQSGRIIRSCLDAAKTILDNGQPEMDEVSQWYSGLNLSCPLLADGLCTFYECRPLACREHIVRGSSVLCNAGETDEPDVIGMPVSVLEVLGRLASELEGTEVEAVMLPLIFLCREEFIERSSRKWPAIEMVKRFVELLEQTAAQTQTG